MKQILVFYATLEGQCRKVAEHAAGRLRDKGLGVRLLDVRDVHPGLSLQDFRAALIVAPVHASLHPRKLVSFVRQHRDQLALMPVQMLSVSLAQAGVELDQASTVQRERAAAGVRHVVALFCKATGFPADSVTSIAGCLAYSQYGFLKRLMMRHMARKAGRSTDTSCDHEYTDFGLVDRAVDQLCEGLLIPSAESECPVHHESAAGLRLAH